MDLTSSTGKIVENDLLERGRQLAISTTVNDLMELNASMSFYVTACASTSGIGWHEMARGVRDLARDRRWHEKADMLAWQLALLFKNDLPQHIQKVLDSTDELILEIERNSSRADKKRIFKRWAPEPGVIRGAPMPLKNH